MGQDGAMKAAPTKKDHKQHASTSGDESEEQSEDLELKASKKKHARQEEITSEEEVEEVDDDPVPKPPMEHVNDIDDEQSEPDEDEVSTTDYISQRMNQLTG